MKTYNVIMLGPSGSGKTVLLASMYKKLAIQGDAGFLLEVEGGEKRKRLNNTYMQVAAGETWPRGTRFSEVSEWNFTCRVQTENLPIYSACRFAYLDYAGGRLTDEMEEVDTDFDSKLDQADALLGLLDGQKILDFMRGGKDGNTLVFIDLPNMLQIMQRCGTQNPVHFVISKWDLIESKFSLEQIRERLLQIGEFKQIVQNRVKAGSQVRLIPVSSVGMGFAIPQPDGGMKKTLGALPQPFQVEMPIGCVLPAKIRFELNQIKEKREAEQARSIEVKPNLDFWDNLRLMFADAVNVVREWLPERYQFSDKMLQRLIDFAEEDPRKKQEEAAKRTEELQRDKEATLKAVEDEETALQHVMASFLHIESALDYKFPASNIRLA